MIRDPNILGLTIQDKWNMVCLDRETSCAEKYYARKKYQREVVVPLSDILPPPPPPGPSSTEHSDDHLSKATPIVCDALNTVVRDKIPIDDCDENDYTYLTKLANSLSNNEIKLSALVYKHSDEPRIQVAQIMVAAATLAYIKIKDLRDVQLESEEDENLKADFQWADQRAILCAALSLDKLKESEHPFLAEAAREL